jgi:capsid protein
VCPKPCSFFELSPSFSEGGDPFGYAKNVSAKRHPRNRAGYITVDITEIRQRSNSSISTLPTTYRRADHPAFRRPAARAGVTVLRDPCTAKPYVLFYTPKRVGGGVQNFDAIKLLKFAVS